MKCYSVLDGFAFILNDLRLDLAFLSFVPVGNLAGSNARMRVLLLDPSEMVDIQAS